LIIRCPWKTAAAGQITGVLAEAVDIYPTLAALAGLPTPQSQGEDVNGTNLEPVFDTPGLGAVAAALKTAAFSQLAKANLAKPFQIGAPKPPGGPARNTTEIMGYSVRVEDWRYTCWFKFDHVSIVPITTAAGIIGRELYDHREDGVLPVPGEGENVNVVSDAAHVSVVQELHAAVIDYIRLYPIA
jgi:iduronate 2-sulfatase